MIQRSEVTFEQYTSKLEVLIELDDLALINFSGFLEVSGTFQIVIETSLLSILYTG